jgi:hypothetical protein
LVVERNAVSGIEHNLPNSSKSRDVPAGCLVVDDNARAETKSSIRFSLFHILPRDAATFGTAVN